MITKLSAPAGILRDMSPNPWQRLADDWPHVYVVTEDLGTQWAETRWMKSGRIELAMNARLNRVERRMCAAHECEHLDLGRPHGQLRARQEQHVRSLAAAWLLPDLEEVGRTLAVFDLHRAADELWVTWPVLVDRLNHLTDDESQFVHQFREDIA